MCYWIKTSLTERIKNKYNQSHLCTHRHGNSMYIIPVYLKYRIYNLFFPEKHYMSYWFLVDGKDMFLSFNYEKKVVKALMWV